MPGVDIDKLRIYERHAAIEGVADIMRRSLGPGYRTALNATKSRLRAQVHREDPLLTLGEIELAVALIIASAQQRLIFELQQRVRDLKRYLDDQP